MQSSTLSHVALLVVLTWGCGSGDDKSPDSSSAGKAGTGPSSSGSGNSGGNSNAASGSANASGAGGSSTNAAGNGTGGSAVTDPQAGASDGGTSSSGGAPPMPDPVGTTPEAKWVNVTGTLAGMASECGNLGRVDADPFADLLIVGVAKKGLFGSTDGGASWKPLGTTGDMITNRISSIAYDPTAPMTFWESGIYNGAGVYKTTDNGASFVQVGSVTHSDSVSVDFSDPARMLLVAGSHEQSQKLFRSLDGGANWTDIGKGLPA